MKLNCEIRKPQPPPPPPSQKEVLAEPQPRPAFGATHAEPPVSLHLSPAPTDGPLITLPLPGRFSTSFPWRPLFCPRDEGVQAISTPGYGVTSTPASPLDPKQPATQSCRETLNSHQRGQEGRVLRLTGGSFKIYVDRPDLLGDRARGSPPPEGGARQGVPLSVTSPLQVESEVFLFAVAVAAFHLSLAAPADLSSEEDIPIVKDERVLEDDGKFNFEIETGNGIRMSQGGSPDGVDGAVNHAGQYSYTAPDGTLVELKFVANENGFQPQSALLPVAPEFPHPIPQFVLDQIAFAALQDAKESEEEEEEDDD
ncbi:hypothetical protein O3P69_020838 [Scylla paramamosain]|uniref:Larval cuticle protein LCP-17 n=1 Tax=Scylla paramamosain TaxID=85552 RepID=A0AAW0TN43_SCYPA